MATYKTLGIILRRINYGEADRIITFLTPDQGKVSAIAKGIRRLNSRLGAHLELFSEVELMLAKGRNLDVVTSARIKTDRGELATDYEHMRRAFLFCEMVDKLTSESTEAAAYELLDTMLESLKSQDPVLTELYFKLQLLDQLGYRPNLEQCMQSQEEIQSSKRYFFNVEKGGVVEQRFAEPRHPELSGDHIKLWRLVFMYPLAELGRVKGTAKAASESLVVANDFYDYLFGKRFRASEI